MYSFGSMSWYRIFLQYFQGFLVIHDFQKRVFEVPPNRFLVNCKLADVISSEHLPLAKPGNVVDLRGWGGEDENCVREEEAVGEVVEFVAFDGVEVGFKRGIHDFRETQTTPLFSAHSFDVFKWGLE